MLGPFKSPDDSDDDDDGDDEDDGMIMTRMMSSWPCPTFCT